MKLCGKIKTITPSITVAITSKFKQMRQQGEDVIGFTAGEPDFDTPIHIKEAAKKAIEKGQTKYTPAAGINELREAVAIKFKKENNIDYIKDEIIISNGAKQSLMNAFSVLLNKNEEVIVPSPYWVSYPEQIKVADGKAVFCDTDNIKIKADLIKEKIAPNTKIIVLNSPNNPSGHVIPKAELKRIANLAIENCIYVVSDEVYEKYIYIDEPHVSIASLGEEIKKLAVTINGVSKTYAMTGWRIGYCGADKEITKLMLALQSHSTGNPCSISQYAALEALTASQDCISEMKNIYAKRRILMKQMLSEMDKLSCIEPEGAFYAFVDIRKTGLKSMDFCQKLLEKEKVAAIPGIGFGMDDYIRLSYAVSEEDIKEGLERIKRFIGGL